MDEIRRGDLVEQHVGGNAIGYSAAGQQECDRAASAIGRGVDFRPPRDRPIACVSSPLFLPKRSDELSLRMSLISTSAGGPPYRLAAQRTNRL